MTSFVPYQKQAQKQDQKQDQKIISGSGWHLDIDYPESGSLGKLTFNILSGSVFVSSSTDKVAFFNDEYSQLVVNRTTGSDVGVDDTIEVYLKEGFQGRIRNTISTTINVPSGSNGWSSGQELKIGGSTLTGSIDEFRLWSAPLSESVINNHTLMPEAINGNHVSSSTEDLMFRLDFELPKDRHSGGDPFIKNVSVNKDVKNDSNVAQNVMQIQQKDSLCGPVSPKRKSSFV